MRVYASRSGEFVGVLQPTGVKDGEQVHARGLGASSISIRPAWALSLRTSRPRASCTSSWLLPSNGNSHTPSGSRQRGMASTAASLASSVPTVSGVANEAMNPSCVMLVIGSIPSCSNVRLAVILAGEGIPPFSTSQIVGQIAIEPIQRITKVPFFQRESGLVARAAPHRKSSVAELVHTPSLIR